MATYRSSLPGSKLGKAFFLYILYNCQVASFFLNLRLFFFFFFVLLCFFTSQDSSYGYGGTISSPNHTFSWASSKLFHDQSPRKYRPGLGSNSRPLGLQSDFVSVARHVTDCTCSCILRNLMVSDISFICI